MATHTETSKIRFMPDVEVLKKELLAEEEELRVYQAQENDGRALSELKVQEKQKDIALIQRKIELASQGIDPSAAVYELRVRALQDRLEKAEEKRDTTIDIESMTAAGLFQRELLKDITDLQEKLTLESGILASLKQEKTDSS